MNSDYEFAIWAFGDVWDEFLLWEKDSMDLLQAWNYRHGDLLFLHEYDAVNKSMNEMKQLWEKYGDKQKTSRSTDDIKLEKEPGTSTQSIQDDYLGTNDNSVSSSRFKKITKQCTGLNGQKDAQDN